MKTINYKWVKISLIFNLAFLIFNSQKAVAQAPQGINYQGVARNNIGAAISNTGISVQFKIYQGSTSGTPVFTETQSATTDTFGLFSLVIGSVSTAQFNAINWSAGNLSIQIDINGVPIATTQLMSVPYALYAGSAGSSSSGITSVTGASPITATTTSGAVIVGLATVGTATTVGSSTSIPSFTVDSYGRIIGVASNTVATSGGTVTSLTVGAGLTAPTNPITSTGSIDLPTFGVNGIYGSATTIPTYTVDTYGRITGVSTNTLAAAPVNSVGASSPLFNSGTTVAPVISSHKATANSSGYLDSLDWNTFNNKGNGTVTSITTGTGLLPVGTFTNTASISADNTSALWNASQLQSTPVTFSATPTAGQVLQYSGTSTGWVNTTPPLPGITTSVTVNSPLVNTSTVAATPNLAIHKATANSSGYLDSLDWNTFNNKGNGTVTTITTNSANITSSGTTTVSLDLAAVPTLNPGLYGNATSIPQYSVDTYGRIVSSTTVAIAPAGVSSVSAAAPLSSSGGSTPTISLTTSGVTAGTYGNATSYPTYTVDTYGRITNASTQTVVTGVWASSPLQSTGGANPNISINSSGVTPGLYGNATNVPQYSVDVYGRIVSSTTFPISNVPGGAASGDLTGTYPAPTLITSGVTSGTYGSATQVPSFSVDAKGRITTASNITIPTGVTSVTANAPLSSSGGSTPTISLTTSGVTAGTYGNATSIPQYSVDAYGRIVSSTTVAIAAGVTGTGTVNYMPKWTSTTGLSSTSLIFDDGTNVGIGTSAPTALLDVTGNTTASDVKTHLINTGTGNVGLELRTAGPSQYIDFQDASTSNVGNGTPDFRQRIMSGAGGLSFHSNLSASIMTISNAGNVGIHTTTPAYPLDITSSYSVTMNSVNTSTNGAAGMFQITTATNAAPVIYGTTNGTGPAVYGFNTGTGSAGLFRITNTLSTTPALNVSTNGTGNSGNFSGGAGLQTDKITITAGATSGAVLTSNGAGNAAWQMPAVPAVTAVANGLSLTSGTVELGGTLTQNTTINQNAFNMTYSATTGNVQINSASSFPTLSVTTTGTGNAGYFSINNTGAGNAALYANTNGVGNAIFGYNSGGTGSAGLFSINNATNTATALNVSTNGTGTAGLFTISNVGNSAPSLSVTTNGTGNVINATTSGTGTAGFFQITNTTSIGTALYATTNGTGNSGYFSGGAGLQTDKITITAGATSGAVLTSNGAGNAAWQIPALGVGGTGTVNYMPKWTSTTGLSSTSLIFDNGTGVGIGTTTPGALLDIGPSAAGTSLRVTNTNTTGGTAGYFDNTSATNPNAAIQGTTSGTGNAGNFAITNSVSTAPTLSVSTNGAAGSTAVQGWNSGTGSGGNFQVTNAASFANALLVATAGGGNSGNFSGGAGLKTDGFTASAKVITGNYVLLLTDFFIVYNAGSSVTITLPSSASPGKIYVIKNGNSSMYLTTNINYINLTGGSTNQIQYMSTVSLIYDGTNWQQW